MNLFYPANAPEVNGDAITLDVMLKEPTRIARYISDITAAGLFTPKLFTTGGANGGAILYDVVTKNDLFTDDAMGEIAPGAVYPRVDASPAARKVVRTKKIGGAFDVTDEARNRNDITVIQRAGQKVANTMVRDVDALGINAIKDSLQTYSSDVISVDSDGWVKTNKVKASDVTKAQSIRADINKCLAEGKKTQLGYKYDLLIIHPDDKLQLSNSFDSDRAESEFLAAKGLTVVETPFIEAGKAWVAAGGQVGVMGVEEPISTVTYREENRDVTVTKTRAMVAFAVTDPVAVIQLNNLQAA